MRKKDILKLKSTAYYSGFNGLEIKGIECGIDEYLLCVTGGWSSQPTAHRLKIYYPPKVAHMLGYTATECRWMTV